MSRQRLTVVLSQAQGKNPTKRALEESIAASLILEPVQGDMVVLAWMFPRAAFWLLDRDGIKGHYGENHIEVKDDEEEGEPEPPRGIGAVEVPERSIYCLDLRDHGDHRVYVDEVK